MGKAGKDLLLYVLLCLCAAAAAAAAVALLLRGVSVTDRCFVIAVHMCVSCGICEPDMPALFETPPLLKEELPYTCASFVRRVPVLRLSPALEITGTVQPALLQLYNT